MPSLLSVQRHDSVQTRRPFSHIVVAVDSSTAADRAVRLAISVARADVCIELLLCHVIDIQRMLAHADQYADDSVMALEAARAEAGRLLDRCVALAARSGVFARACIRYGKPVPEITMLAHAYAADLIVIGNRPSDRIRRILCGSVRDEMVRESSVPVLVADAHTSAAPELSERRILAVLADASASPAALRFASRIANAYGRELVCLPPADRWTRAGCRAIERAVAEQQPAMLVIGATRQGTLRALFSPDIVEHTLQYAGAPVLVVHE